MNCEKIQNKIDELIFDQWSKSGKGNHESFGIMHDMQ